MVENVEQETIRFVKAYGWTGPVFAISAIKGTGCKALVYAIMEHLDAVKLAQQHTETHHAQIAAAQQ